jgi:predicted RNA-binding protein
LNEEEQEQPRVVVVVVVVAWVAMDAANMFDQRPPGQNAAALRRENEREREKKERARK